MRRSNVFRNLNICLIAIFLWCGASQTALAQDVSVDSAAADKADASTYRMLFLQSADYKKMADDARAANQDKEYLRKIVPEMIEISDADAANLERLSSARQCGARAPAYEGSPGHPPVSGRGQNAWAQRHRPAGRAGGSPGAGRCDRAALPGHLAECDG